MNKHTDRYIAKSRYLNTIEPLCNDLKEVIHCINVRGLKMYYDWQYKDGWQPTKEQLEQLEKDADLLFKIKMVIREHK